MQLQPYEFEQDYFVYRYDGDFLGNIQPGSILRYAQQIATAQCTALGIDDSVYARTHTAYLLARLAFHVARLPRVDERLTLVTQPEAMHHAVNKRLTCIYDEQGEECVFVDSRWVLIDTDKRTILRNHPEEFSNHPWAGKLPRSLPMRIKKLTDAETVATLRADYSLCDMNGHLNNTRYADIIFNLLPLEVIRTQTVEDFLIYYHKEIPLGQSFRVCRAQMEENKWFFSGWHEDTCCFEANITMRPISQKENSRID